MRKDYFYKALRTVLPLIGLLIGGVKIFGLPTEVELFRRMGLSDGVRVGFGALQAMAGLLIWIPAAEVWGIFISAGLLAAAMVMMLAWQELIYVAAPVTGITILMLFFWLRKASSAHESVPR